MKINRLIAALVIGTSLILVSCKDTSNPQPSSGNNTPLVQNQTTPQAGYTEVLIPGRNFSPDSLTVAVGTTVNWTSKDGEFHTITSDIPELFNGSIEPFGSFAYTFNKTGDYEYFCSVHGQMGMRGVVHVQ